MKTAVIQMASGPDKEHNIEKALFFTRDSLAKKAQFVCLPEYFYFRGSLKTRTEVLRVVERIDGPTVSLFAALARQGRAHILLGSIYESVGMKGCVYDTSVLIGPDGKIKATYRKNNLFHIRSGKKEVREADTFKPGTKIAMTDVGPFTLGMCLCFDVRFPALFEQYSRRGADLFTLPAAFSRSTGQAHWEVLVRARAIETLSYVVAPAQTGCDAQGLSCCGQSMIIDPWGCVLARASQDKEEVIYANLDPDEPRQRRRMFPGFKNLK